MNNFLKVAFGEILPISDPERSCPAKSLIEDIGMRSMQELIFLAG